MANHPCSFGPPVLRLAHAEQVDEPVQVGLEVRRVHARESPEVALQPRAQVVHHLHGLEVGRVARVRLVGLRGAPLVGDDAVVGALLVVHDRAALRQVAPQRGPYPLGRRLSVPADECHRRLGRVDGDGYAQLLLRQAALAGLPAPLREVGVVDVDLVDPHAAPEHDAVLVAPHRGEDAVAPLECGLVGDAAELGGRLDGHVPRHELDEADPGREVLLAVLEDGARQGAEARSAVGAPEPSVPGGRPAVPGDATGPAAGAGRARPKRLGGLVEGPASDPVAAGPRLDGLPQQREVGVRHGVDPRGVGVSVDVHSVVPSTQAPTRPGRRQT